MTDPAPRMVLIPEAAWKAFVDALDPICMSDDTAADYRVPIDVVERLEAAAAPHPAPASAEAVAKVLIEWRDARQAMLDAESAYSSSDWMDNTPDDQIDVVGAHLRGIYADAKGRFRQAESSLAFFLVSSPAPQLDLYEYMGVEEDRHGEPIRLLYRGPRAYGGRQVIYECADGTVAESGEALFDKATRLRSLAHPAPADALRAGVEGLRDELEEEVAELLYAERADALQDVAGRLTALLNWHRAALLAPPQPGAGAEAGEPQ